MNDSKKTSKSQTVGSIYLIYCIVTDKFYVGQTIQKVSARIYSHKRGDQFIDKEIQKIGWEGNFDYFILEENLPVELLNERERYWIKKFDCVHPNGYNLTHGGQDHHEITEETRFKLREAAIRQERKPLTAEQLERLRRANLGKKQSPETRAKKRATALAKGIRPPVMYGADNPNYKKDFSEETRAKMRAAKVGKEPWNKGKKCPHVAAHKKGIPRSEETKEKIRITFLKKRIMREIYQALIEMLSE